MKVDLNACVWFVQSELRPSDEEWNDCCRLIYEILDIAFDGQAVHQEVVWQPNMPESGDYLKIMTQSIFEEIAREVAPSQLGGPGMPTM